MKKLSNFARPLYITAREFANAVPVVFPLSGATGVAFLPQINRIDETLFLFFENTFWPRRQPWEVNDGDWKKV